jgi:hypothetical protein
MDGDSGGGNVGYAQYRNGVPFPSHFWLPRNKKSITEGGERGVEGGASCMEWGKKMAWGAQDYICIKACWKHVIHIFQLPPGWNAALAGL